MSYTPTDWKNGDIITEERLDHMEQGIADANSGSGVLVVTDTEGTLNKTWQEINDAGFAVRKLAMPDVMGGGASFSLLSFTSKSGGFSAVFYSEYDGTLEEMVYVADTADGYPTLSDNGDGGFPPGGSGFGET